MTSRQLTYIRRFCYQPGHGKGFKKFVKVTEQISKLVDQMSAEESSSAHRADMWTLRKLGMEDSLLEKIAHRETSWVQKYYWTLQGMMKAADSKDGAALFRFITKKSKGKDTDENVAEGTSLDADMYEVRIRLGQFR